MADETIVHVAVVKEVIVFARFLGEGRKVRTAFIGMIGVTDVCASTIMGVIINICEDNQLDLEHKLVAFGIDGASVMIDRRNGVSALLKQTYIKHHSIASWQTSVQMLLHG